MNDADVRQTIRDIANARDYDPEQKLEAIMFVLESQTHARLRNFVITTSVRNMPDAVTEFNRYSIWFMSLPLPVLLRDLWGAKTFGEALKKEEEVAQFNKYWTDLLKAPIMYDERQDENKKNS